MSRARLRRFLLAHGERIVRVAPKHMAGARRSSRNTKRHRLDPGGNRQLNCALHRLAVNKARYCPDTAAYLARKQAEGKSRKEAIRCLKRHLARRVWKLMRSSMTSDPAATPSPDAPTAGDTVTVTTSPYPMACTG